MWGDVTDGARLPLECQARGLPRRPVAPCPTPATSWWALTGVPSRETGPKKHRVAGRWVSPVSAPWAAPSVGPEHACQPPGGRSHLVSRKHRSGRRWDPAGHLPAQEAGPPHLSGGAGTGGQPRIPQLGGGGLHCLFCGSGENEPGDHTSLTGDQLCGQRRRACRQVSGPLRGKVSGIMVATHVACTCFACLVLSSTLPSTSQALLGTQRQVAKTSRPEGLDQCVGPDRLNPKPMHPNAEPSCPGKLAPHAGPPSPDLRLQPELGLARLLKETVLKLCVPGLAQGGARLCAPGGRLTPHLPPGGWGEQTAPEKTAGSRAPDLSSPGVHWAHEVGAPRSVPQHPNLQPVFKRGA